MLRQKHVQLSPVNVTTIYVPTVISTGKPMLESSVLKTVQQASIKLERSITRAEPASQVNFLAHGINTNAKRGPIAPPASTSPRTAQAALTVFAAAAYPEHIPPAPTPSIAPRGPIA